MTVRRRVFRRIIDVVCVLGILLLIALWVRSYGYRDAYWIRYADDWFVVVAEDNVMEVGFMVNVDALDGFGPIGWYRISNLLTAGINLKSNKIFDITWTAPNYFIAFPTLLPILLLSIFPLWHFIAYVRHRRSIPKGHVLCKNCGYDLFGSLGEKCPECGAEVAASSVGSSADQQQTAQAQQR